MWKLVAGFIVFAVAALYMISRGGDIDMGGEKHTVEAHGPAHDAPAPAAAAPASEASK
jgi:hypothetical protein